VLPGIPEEFRPRIFEKFSQAAEVGAGSAFWVELPGARVNVAAGTAADPTGQNQSFEFRARSR